MIEFSSLSITIMKKRYMVWKYNPKDITIKFRPKQYDFLWIDELEEEGIVTHKSKNDHVYVTFTEFGIEYINAMFGL